MGDVAGKATLPANARRIPIPAAAMTQWLADIDDIVELKVTLRTLALLSERRARGPVPPGISLYELLDDPFLEAGMNGTAIRQGLAWAIARRTLLVAQCGGEVRVFLNDEDCRRYVASAGVTELTAADLTAPADTNASEGLPQPPTTGEPRANIFALYERHIGPYGHSIAEQLRAAEEEYPAEWVQAALEVAAKNDKRHWNYVIAILRRWVKEGRHEHGEPGSDTASDSRTGYLDSYRRRHGRLPWDPGEPEQR
jgi:DnaD/phage-associated family protein